MVYLYLPLAIVCWILAVWFWKRYEVGHSDSNAACFFLAYTGGAQFMGFIAQDISGISSDVILVMFLFSLLGWLVLDIIRNQLRLSKSKPSDPTSTT